MYIKRNPDEWTTVVEHKTCEIHKKYPGVSHPHCMCSGSYSLRKATSEEREENKKRRLERERKEADCFREFPI